MFGYVKPFMPELKVRQMDEYNAFYCGLCRSMKKHTGVISTLSLSYDCTFLTIVRTAVLGDTVTAKKIRCVCHPTKAHAAIDDNGSLTFAAFVSAILTYYKLADDRADEASFKRMLASLAMPTAKRMKRKSDMAMLEAVVAKSLVELDELEKAKSQSIDETAGKFGDILSAVFSYGFDGAEKRILAEFGYHIGKCIYIADATDDAGADLKKGRYNPIVSAYGEDAVEVRSVTVGKKAVAKRLLTKEVASDIMRAYLIELSEADKALALIERSGNADLWAIIDNVVRIGMPKELDRVLCGLPEQTHKTMIQI